MNRFRYAFCMCSDLIISLQYLTNEILDNIDDISMQYNNKLWHIKGVNPDLNIDKLMEKLVNCKFLEISYNDTQNINNPNINFNRTIAKLPPKLESFTHHNNLNNILEYPDTLKQYHIYDYKNDIINIPSNLPSTLEELYLTCNSINEKTFNNIPIYISKLYIYIYDNAENINNLLLPMCLRHYSLFYHFLIDNIPQINILPYGLETFEFKCDKYNYSIELPNTIETFKFYCYEDKYIYADCLNNLPNSIKHLEIYYDTCPNVYILPANCKTFIYVNCPLDVLFKLQKNYPNVHITDEN